MANELSPSSGKCLVCETPNTSAHFGIDACRACASFFKRALVKNCHYTCNQGDSMCKVVKAAKMCRGCRFDKCVAVGMTYNGPMRPRRLQSKDEEVQSSEESVPSSSKDRDESLLERIAREHTASYERRYLKETELVRQNSLIRMSHPTEEVYLATYECGLAAFNITHSENWRFFLNVFPSLKELPYDDQREFFSHCMPQFGMFDCFSRTKKIFRGFSKYSMNSLLMCVDMENPEVWTGPEGGGENREEILESVRAYIHDLLTKIVPSFESMELCETEKHALIALMLCESDIRGDLVERFIDGIRKAILAELHNFYIEEMGLSEYSTRLGNLLTICHTFREGNALFQEWFRMQTTIFDLYVTESSLHKLLL